MNLIFTIIVVVILALVDIAIAGDGVQPPLQQLPPLQPQQQPLSQQQPLQPQQQPLSQQQQQPLKINKHDQKRILLTNNLIENHKILYNLQNNPKNTPEYNDKLSAALKNTQAASLKHASFGRIGLAGKLLSIFGAAAGGLGLGMIATDYAVSAAKKQALRQQQQQQQQQQPK